MFDLNAALDYAQRNQDEFISSLKEFLTIPSISLNNDDPQAIRKASQWLEKKLTELRLSNVEIFETDKYPIVYAEDLTAGPQAPTVLIYGHYDVVPAEPLDSWDTPPFEPSLIGDNLYARGAADNKGEIMLSISAFQSIIHSGSAPLNIKFLLEGEEEIGSVSLRKFAQIHKELLSADFCLNLDGTMASHDLPSIIYGLRGYVLLKFKISGTEKELHSGFFGGVVENPIHVLARLITNLRDEQGHVQLEGFYDSVREVSDQERALMASSPRDEAFYLSETGAKALWGDPKIPPNERVGAQPSLEVLGLNAGLGKNAIPTSAECGISIRTVPDQDPEKILDQLLKYISDQIPTTLTLEIIFQLALPGVLLSFDSPHIAKISKAFEQVWGQPPVFERMGGSIPAVEILSTELGIDSIITGITLPDDNVHGHNEKIHLPTWNKGLEAVIRFFHSFGS